jgi:UPF0755 protein
LKKTLAFFAGIFCLFLVVVAVLWRFAVFLDSPPPGMPVTETAAADFSGGEQRFETRHGETALGAGKRLHEAGLIRSFFYWRLLCRLHPDYIKAGVYALKSPSRASEILELLQHGRQLTVSVTVPEGLTISRIAKILEDAEVSSAEDFIEAAHDTKILARYNIERDSLEGYLFPDTYDFPIHYGAEKVVLAMTENFEKKILEISGGKMPEPKELDQKVILASIIEREYRARDEAGEMAGVFYNRLGTGMRLQSCATVEYIITEIQGRPHPERLYNRDLEIRNPYNTYIVSGLPPGPISAPGRTALEAVFNPAQNDYLYFRLVEPEDGRHFFSKTYGEHLNAETLYLKRRP